jgi:hypothetical protein
VQHSWEILFHTHNRIKYCNRIQVCDFSFCDFCINSTNYIIFILSNIQRHEFWLFYLQTDRQTVMPYNRSIQYYQQPEVAELPLHELEIHDSGLQFIVQKLSPSQKLKLSKFCSFRNFTHTPPHTTEYLILIQLNYLNTLWNLSILVWCAEEMNLHLTVQLQALQNYH